MKQRQIVTKNQKQVIFILIIQNNIQGSKNKEPNADVWNRGNASRQIITKYDTVIPLNKNKLQSKR